MTSVLENVACSIVASIICNIGNYSLGQLKTLNTYFKKDTVEKYVLTKLEGKYDILCESGVLIEFSKNPLVIDTMNNYIIYIITGKIETKISLENIIKKNKNHIIEENDVIDFLSNNLMHKYEINNVVNKPSMYVIKNFFFDAFKICSEYIFEQMNKENIAMVYFINSRMNILENNFFSKLNNITNILEKSIETKIIYHNDKLLENKKYYTKILKENNKMAHIYLLDKFNINEFYVPPFLAQSSELKKRFNMKYICNSEQFEYSIASSFNSKKELFDDWKYIFESSNIVYVTGGAGYGKSLFMKKIIEEYNKLNLIDADDYMVIYGELKMFFAQNPNIPMSVIDFLQNSMKKETLIEEDIVSKDLINYYLERGRCIILLDALDEVEKNKRDNLHELVINYFKNQNPNNKVCLTSRARGFLPEKDIEVFEIEPLEAIQIETYVDNIIRLRKFDPKDKDSFLKQTKILVNKGFLNSFLVLSLLINIYKAERELPENKLELYQKCFEYIATKRERDKEKSQEKYDWKLISILMKDNTFMELANMCLPNNNDVSKETIKEQLTAIYKTKYVSENETELAIEQFLQFCSDRTELFVPASGEDCFKFFHRSFFEYFYSQYIFTRLQTAESIYNAFSQFDVDSEVFELTLAMFKQKNENKYQEIIEFIFKKMNNDSLKNEDRINATNILILGLQVIDDELYKEKFINFIIKESNFCIKNIKNLHNQSIIVNIIESKKEYYDKVCEKYKTNAIFEAIISLLKLYSNVENLINENENQKSDTTNTIDNDMSIFKFKHLYSFNFYSQIFFNHTPINSIFENLKTNDIEELGLICNFSNKEINKLKAKYKKYLKLHAIKRQKIEKILFDTSK